MAEREAIALEKEGRLKLVRHRYRKYRIEKIALPLESEVWLTSLFGGKVGSERLERSFAILRQNCARLHLRYPQEWVALCNHIQMSWETGETCRPFSWRHPELVERAFDSLFALTSKDWRPGIRERIASELLGWGSKGIEERRAELDAALVLMFGEPFSLESLGLVGTLSRVIVQGPLVIHFADGSSHDTSSLQGPATITHADLLRATHATTAAARLLSIENEKSTFADACTANREGDTLLLATSYPTAATLRLLELLSEELPHFHFGDTDVSGYAILNALRQRSPRPVHPFLMVWEDDVASKALSEYDQRLLPALLESDLLEDCREQLERIKYAGRKGRFEQERYGIPELPTWPFWRASAPFRKFPLCSHNPEDVF
ncbi:Wadjet anti-phage system protein JetD domain-containing protein [Roseimicrobium gellanilyticum]|uniref:Wadjet anti-phage system protein JetD domain-containing protein n=1 Tax=Roseimicrobium gellanilyticum TaxID=748857 RepID=UPI001B87D49B|nr:Wadjet anti-phage system protein JetD domain-containing protein [Roseimicrobium gellanilyticum]